jgi:hypothetical protein
MKIGLIQIVKDATRELKYTGTHPQAWFNKIKHNENYSIDKLSILNQANKFDRTVLKNYLRQDNLNDKSALIAIMAWGNRNMKNARLMFDKSQNEKCIIQLVNKLSSGFFSTRKEAFEYFISEK